MGTAFTDWLKEILIGVSVVAAIMSVTACHHTPNFAPVVDISQAEPLPSDGFYTVKNGDTLYSIAWRYGLDYHEIALINNLGSSYTVYNGQKLQLKKSSLNRKQKVAIEKTLEKNESNKPVSIRYGWTRPADGPIVIPFGKKHKGINIAGRMGDPVRAASGGKVVYAGDGLRGYGNLIIIKHDSQTLSAYAHNQSLLVKTGDTVKAGQIIARMGDADTNRVMLHFEVRRNGKPVNPKMIKGIMS